MIVVQGDFVMKPGRRDEAIASMLKVAQATKQEPGCIRYDFYADLEDPQHFIIFEEWESLEALQAHLSPDDPPAYRVAFRQVQAEVRESGSVHFMQAEIIQP